MKDLAWRQRQLRRRLAGTSNNYFSSSSSSSSSSLFFWRKNKIINKEQKFSNFFFSLSLFFFYSGTPWQVTFEVNTRKTKRTSKLSRLPKKNKRKRKRQTTTEREKKRKKEKRKTGKGEIYINDQSGAAGEATEVKPLLCVLDYRLFRASEKRSLSTLFTH